MEGKNPKNFKQESAFEISNQSIFPLNLLSCWTRDASSSLIRTRHGSIASCNLNGNYFIFGLGPWLKHNLAAVTAAAVPLAAVFVGMYRDVVLSYAILV